MTVLHVIGPPERVGTSAGVPWIDAGSAADVSERECRCQTRDPLLQDLLLDEEGPDRQFRVTSASPDHGYDVSVHLVRVGYGLGLVSHRHLHHEERGY